MNSIRCNHPIQHAWVTRPVTRRRLLGSALASGMMHFMPVNANSGQDTLRPISIGDVTLSTYEAGEGPVVLLVHGAVADLRFWLPLTRQLADKYTIILYSLRGHDSGRPGRTSTDQGAGGYARYDLRQHADDLVALVNKLSATRVHLIGHDIGANVAMCATMRHAKIAASLTLSDTSELGLAIADSGFREAIEWDRRTIDGIGGHIAAKRPAQALRLFLNRYVGAETHDAPQWIRGMYRANTACLPMLLKMYRDEPALDISAFDNIRVPLNFISGSFTRVSSRAVNDALSARFASAAHVLLPGGYLAPVLYPVEYGRVVRSILEKAGGVASISRT